MSRGGTGVWEVGGTAGVNYLPRLNSAEHSTAAAAATQLDTVQRFEFMLEFVCVCVCVGVRGCVS